MDCPKAILFLLSAFFGCFSSPADAQINLKSGYNLSVLSTPSLDEIITSFDQAKTYTSGFGRLKWLHGFEAGIRFKSNLHAIEASYQGAYQTLKAIGLNNGLEYTDRLRFDIHSAAIGYQISDRIFGVGADLQYQFYRVKFKPGQDEDDFTNVQNMFAMKYYLMFTLRGHRGVDMAIQPYYVLPFKNYDLLPLGQFFHTEPSPEADRWNRFGLSILFYNGEK